MEVGLPRAFERGDMSTPMTEADLLVGGEVLNPWDETGDLTGEGDLLTPPDDKELRPAT